MTLQGFCLTEMSNVPAGPDRRCINDNSLVIAPSTSCAHRRWLGVDGWSACGQENPCKPRPADAWRAVLKQQAGAVRKSEADRAASRAKLRTTSRRARRCAHCLSMFKVPLGSPNERQCVACRKSPRPLATCTRCQQPRVCQASGLCEYCARTLRKQAARTVKTWHPRHVSCCDCHGTDRPHYQFGRCRPCFDRYDEARQWRRIAS
jgi:hypothetical protein